MSWFLSAFCTVHRLHKNKAGFSSKSYEHEFPGPTLGYVLEFYERHPREPDAVDEASRKILEKAGPCIKPVTTANRAAMNPVMK